MVHVKDRLVVRSLFRCLSGLVFQHVVLLLTHFNGAQLQKTGPPEPIKVMVGDDTVLPCHLEPPMDAVQMTIEWGRPDLNPRFAYVWHNGQELLGDQNIAYKGRTALSVSKLKQGDVSLRLSKVKVSDNGSYRCYIPRQSKEYFVELVVGAVSAAGISLAGLDKSTGGVVLQCESKGWYPEPEVLWLDGEGNVLSAGPTETVRGPDDLYTVSSRVTVDKRHGHRFTCRVQQNIINQTRETHIHVTDDFFNVQSSILPLTVGLAVSLAVCFLSVLSFALLLWNKQNINCKRNQQDEMDFGKSRNHPTTSRADVEIFTEDKKEREQLMAEETVQMEDLNKEKLIEYVQKKQAELQQLHDQHQKKEKYLKDRLSDKYKEHETLKAELEQWWFWSSSKEECWRKKMEAEREVETLKKLLETT